MGRTLKAKFFGLMAGLAASMYTASAMADIPNLFTPVAGDKSISMILQPIFGGDLFSMAGGAGGVAGSTPFETAMGLLNGIALLVGGFLTFYMLVVGTMMTAHDGENLGRKWSSVWVPIRTALGTAMVVPVSGGAASGYCAAQLLMGWLVTQGIGAADQLWSGYVSSAYTAQGMQPTTVLPKIESVADGILKSEVCMATLNNVASADANARALIQPDFQASSLSEGGKTIGRQYGSASGTGDECGKIFFAAAEASTGAVTDFGWTPVVDATSMSAVDQAHVSATIAMESTMASIAQAIVTQGPKAAAASGAAFTAAVNTYQQTVVAAAVASSNSSDAFAKMQASAANDGWAMAGGWFTQAANLQNEVNKTITAIPTIVQPRGVGDQFDTILAQNYAALEQFKSNNVTTLGATQANDREESSASGFGWVLQKMNGFLVGSSQWVLSPNPNRNGIMSLKDSGDYMMTASEGAIALAFGVKAGASGIFGKAAKLFVGDAMNFAADVLVALATPFFLLGATLAVYIPMLPFMIYFGTVIGWVILVAEAVIAAPLWGIMHLNPNGDEMAGAARQGYMMVLGLMLRPVLIVLGFIFACLAVDPLIKMFSSVFFPVFRASMGASVIGIGTILVMSFMYVSAMIMLINRVFGFIHVIPDQLLRWIGGGSEQLGQYGGGMGEGSKAAVGMAMGKAGGAMQGLAGAAQNYRQASDNKKMQANQLQGQELDRELAGDRQKEAIQESQGSRMSGLSSNATQANLASDSALANGGSAGHLAAMRQHGAVSSQAKQVAADGASTPQMRQKAEELAANSASAQSEHYDALVNNAQTAGAAAATEGTKEAYQAAAVEFGQAARGASIMNNGAAPKFEGAKAQMLAKADQAPTVAEMASANNASQSKPQSPLPSAD